MNELNYKYIGIDVAIAKKELEDKAYIVQVKKLIPKRDSQILDSQIVVKVEENEKKVTLITSMFKKYI